MKKEGTKKVETQVDRYEVLDQTFKTHREALNAAKRILEDHPEHEIVEIHVYTTWSIKDLGLDAEWSYIEAIKKVYGETGWRYDCEIYF